MQGLQKFSDLLKLAKERVQEVYFEDLYGKQTRPVAHWSPIAWFDYHLLCSSQSRGLCPSDNFLILVKWYPLEMGIFEYQLY